MPDISVNAVANLGYAQGRFLRPVYPGDTLRATSEVIGLKQNSNGKSGVVYVRTHGPEPARRGGDRLRALGDGAQGRSGRARARNGRAGLASAVDAADLVVPDGLTFDSYDCGLAGAPHRWGDYAVGEQIDHVDGMTMEEAEHMLATRLWQNTSKVHFDRTQRVDGKLLAYGGHVISVARALSFNGLANAQMIVAINAGSHANPVLRVTRSAPGPKCWTGRKRPRRRGRAAAAHGGDQGRPVRAARGRGQIPSRCAAGFRLLGVDADLARNRVGISDHKPCFCDHMPPICDHKPAMALYFSGNDAVFMEMTARDA